MGTSAVDTPRSVPDAVKHRPGEARPAWVRPFPAEWMRRLREISPITDRTSYLHPHWIEREECWVLEDCMPAQMLSKDTVTQLSTHWSALPKGRQMGRRRFVSEYKFWMFQTYRVEARPFWCLQGSKYIVGGTPISFTAREERLLEVMGQGAEPIPVGVLPNVPFDERVVSAIQARDRLLKAGGDLDALEKQDRPAALKAADEETEKQYRKNFLAWHKSANAPAADFMTWYLKQEDAQHTLPAAPANYANQITDWQSNYIETGIMRGGMPSSRRVQVAVK